MARIFIYRNKNLLESFGGVEKVLASLSNELAAKGHQVFLACHDKNSRKNLLFKLDESVTFKQFDKHFSWLRHKIFKIFEKSPLLKYMPFFNNNIFTGNQIFEYCQEIKPDVMIASTVTDLIEFLAGKVYDAPKILMLHGHPLSYLKPHRMKLYAENINKADAVQVLMPSFVDAMPKEITTKTVVIGNFIEPMPLSAQSENNIIYMATFCPHKAQDFVIKSFAKVAKKHPEWQLHLWGGHNDKAFVKLCEKLIADNGLENQVFIKGTTKNVKAELDKAKICAFGSNHEGFGLSLAEAMVSGLPAVGRVQCPAVNELIINGENGYLVKNENEFAEKLDLLMSDTNLRLQLGSNGIKLIEKYNVDIIVKMWEDLIIETTNKG